MNGQTSAREAGEIASASCAAKAEMVSSFDTKVVASFIAGLLANGEPVPGEVLVNAAKKAGFEPHDDRAFGSVFSYLSRHRAIRCVGYCDRLKGHGTSGGKVWARNNE